MEIIDLRKAERFVAVEPVPGSFNGADVALLNIGLTGVQITHPSPLRIGMVARLSIRKGEITIAANGHVVWSRLAHNAATKGTPVYRSGLKIDFVDAQYAAAINALYTLGVIKRDADSLVKKKERMEERERLKTVAIRRPPVPSEEPKN
jgi:hypothetical protein